MSLKYIYLERFETSWLKITLDNEPELNQNWRLVLIEVGLRALVETYLVRPGELTNRPLGGELQL